MARESIVRPSEVNRTRGERRRRRKRTRQATAACRSTLEMLENRLLLSVTHTDFSDVSDMQLNGDAKAPVQVTVGANTVNALQVTPHANNQNSSAFVTTPQGVDTFDTTFDFTFGTQDPSADGFTFTLQNSPAGAFSTGGGGGYLGYGMSNSVAVKFKLYPGVSTTGVYMNGDVPDNSVETNPTTTPLNPDVAVNLQAAGIDFHAHPSDVYECHLVYDGSTLTQTVTDKTSSTSLTQKYSVQVPGELGPDASGNHTGYVGFTGATGGAAAEQDILSWTYSGTSTTGPVTLPTPVLSGHDDLPGVANLSWNSFNSHSSFLNNTGGTEIDASTDGGTTYQMVAQVPSGTYTYSDTALDQTKTYMFKVKTLGGTDNFGNTLNDSAFSNIVTIHGSGLQAQPINFASGFPASSSELQLNGLSNLTGAGSQAAIATPTAPPTLAQTTTLPGTATTGLPMGTYYVVYSWASNNNGDTAASPEASIAIAADNSDLQVTVPAAPTGAGNANVFLSTTSGAEKFIGSVSGGKTLDILGMPAANARPAPATNTTTGPIVNANALQVLPNQFSGVGSAFDKNLQFINKFDTTFDFRFGGDIQADGFTFTIQGNNPTAQGGGGGNLGYGGIPNSVAVAFNLYPGTSQTGEGTKGDTPGNVTAPQNFPYVDMTPSGIDFHYNITDEYEAHLTYDGTTLNETVTDLNTGKSFTQAYTVNIPQVVGDSIGYVGFTAASGGGRAEMDVLDWSFPTAAKPTDVINDTGGHTITLKQDGSNVDWSISGGSSGSLPASDGKGLTINNTGAQDTIVLDSSAGNPLPNKLILNGSFVVNGFDATKTPISSLDIGNSSVLISYPAGSDPLSTIQADLKSNKITSSFVAGNSKYGIADIDSADGIVTGQMASTILLKPALIGNATMSGTVGFPDLVALARHYGQSGKDWAAGDFNYDGQVNFTDLVALARNYGQKAGAATAAVRPTLSASVLNTATSLIDLSSKQRRKSLTV